MEWSNDDAGIREYEMCFTYEKNQDRDECCGASGRKLRQACIYCPNYQRWLKHRQKEKSEEKKDEKDH